MDELLQESGFEYVGRRGLAGAYKTNIVKHRPPDNDLKRLNEINHSIDEYIEQIWAEIEAIKPKCILTLGDLALNVITNHSGIRKWRGSILQTSRGYPKVVPTLHPANYLDPKKGAYSQKAYVRLDFARAVLESKSHDLNLPYRNLQIARSYDDIANFFNLYYYQQGLRKCAIDIESSKGIPTCISFAFNSYHAISISLFNIWGNVYIPNEDLSRAWLLIAKMLEEPELQIIGQNFKYDQQKLRRPLGIRIQNIYADTSFMAHTVYPEFPKNLAFLTSILTREPYYKDDGKDFSPKKDSVDRLLTYNARDSVVTFEVYEALLKELEEVGLVDYYFNYKNKLHKFYIDLEDIGFKPNLDKWAELKLKYQTEDREIVEELRTLISDLVPIDPPITVNYNSPLAVAKLIYGRLGIPIREDTKEDTLVQLIANPLKDSSLYGDTKRERLSKQRRVLDRILRIRRVRRVLTAYLNARLDGDGRLRCSYNACGTATNRSSTSILKPPVRQYNAGWPYQMVTKHGDIGNELRDLMPADDGYVLMEPDLSQVEPRFVMLLAGDYDGLKLFDTIDIHKFTAGIAGLVPETEAQAMSKDDPRRFVGKTIRNAGNYGMGKNRAMLEIASGSRRAHIDISVSESQADDMLKKFHARNPKIKGVFHAEVIKALKRDRTLINPFGTRRGFFDRFDDKLFQSAFAQIPQSTVRDHVMTSIFRIQERIPGIRICLEAHDAFVAQVPDNPDTIRQYAIIFKEELQKPIDFAKCTIPRPPISIPTDIVVGKTYNDMKKYTI